MELQKEIIDLISGILNKPVDATTEMGAIQEWDSIRNVMILSALEEHFDILFPEDDIFDLTSVKAITEEIAKLKGV